MHAERLLQLTVEVKNDPLSTNHQFSYFSFTSPLVMIFKSPFDSTRVSFCLGRKDITNSLITTMYGYVGDDVVDSFMDMHIIETCEDFRTVL